MRLRYGPPRDQAHPIRRDPDYDDPFDDFRNPLYWVGVFLCVVAFIGICALIIIYTPGPVR